MDDKELKIREEIVQLLESMIADRIVAVHEYLDALRTWSPKLGSNAAIEKAGILHDVDRHITNLEMELKRIESVARMESMKQTLSGVTRG